MLCVLFFTSISGYYLTVVVWRVVVLHQIDEIKQVFRAFDTNNDGQLSFDEIIKASTVAKGGSGMWSAMDLENVLKKHDINSDALLDSDEFVAMMKDVWVEMAGPMEG